MPAYRTCSFCGRPFLPAKDGDRRCPEHPFQRSPSSRAQDNEYRSNRAHVLQGRPPCRYCGRPATQVDHVVPVSKGGTHALSNLVPCCARCNRSKSDYIDSSPSTQPATDEPRRTPPGFL